MSEADAFAAELLLPAMAARQELVTPITLSSLMPLKSRWPVALAALAHRAHEVGMITERQYRYLLTQISVRGWRKQEPDMGIPVERPRAVRQMAELIYGVPVDVRRLAADLRLMPSRVRMILEAHAGEPASLDEDGPGVPRGAVLPLFPDLDGKANPV